jgi:hypothetical protein
MWIRLGSPLHHTSRRHSAARGGATFEPGSNFLSTPTNCTATKADRHGKLAAGGERINCRFRKLYCGGNCGKSHDGRAHIGLQKRKARSDQIGRAGTEGGLSNYTAGLKTKVVGKAKSPTQMRRAFGNASPSCSGKHNAGRAVARLRFKYNQRRSRRNAAGQLGVRQLRDVQCRLGRSRRPLPLHGPTGQPIAATCRSALRGIRFGCRQRATCYRRRVPTGAR